MSAVKRVVFWHLVFTSNFLTCLALNKERFWDLSYKTAFGTLQDALMQLVERYKNLYHKRTFLHGWFDAATRILKHRLAFAIVRIKVRVAAGFQPWLAIGLSLFHSSSGQCSSPTMTRDFWGFRALFDSSLNSLLFESPAAGLRFVQKAKLANAQADRYTPSLRLTEVTIQFSPGSAHSIQPLEPFSQH